MTEQEKGFPSVNDAKLAIAHFHMLESAVAERLDEMRQHPHGPHNIHMIAYALENLGRMMKESDEYDYMIKLGLGHDAELEILNKIAAITVQITDSFTRYAEYMRAKQDNDEI